MIITAIILNYKNYADTRACLLSLIRQRLPENCELRLLIIDNNSGDDSTRRLQEEFPQQQYVYNAENYGFSRGINQGIALSYEKSAYFLLVNNDAELAADCLSQLLNASGGEALAGPAIFYKAKPTIIWQGGGFFSRLRMNIVVPDKNKTVSPTAAQTVDFLSGCVLLIPKKIIDLIGRLDENFFFYGEDLDFCWRVKKAGRKIYYCPLANAWHNLQSVALSRSSAFVLENLAFSYKLIIRKHFPGLKFYGSLLFIFVYTPFRFYQIISGGNNWLNIKAWFGGARRAGKIKI
jgi:hypothetical protein